jgi:endonuclease YncB( thermonuclease family)
MRRKSSLRGVLCLALLAAAAAAGAGDSLWGRVMAVKEPTLVTLDYGTGSYEIRLVGIDAPKAGDALHGQAVAFVSGLVLNKSARMRLHRRGANDDELVGRLFTDDPEIGIKEVGVELLRAGLARRQEGYDEKYGELAAAEAEARAAGRGIWASAPAR